MNLIRHKQGSEAWKAWRGTVYPASLVASVLDLPDAYEKRSELIRRHKLALPEKEINGHQAYIFAEGHAMERMARPIIEAQFNLTLSALVGQLEDSKISASFDGYCIFSGIVWEHKALRDSDAARERFQLALKNELTPRDFAQVQQQLLVSGAEYALFTVSDGTAENMATVKVLPDPDYFERIKSAWASFEEEVQAYQAADNDNQELERQAQRLKLIREQLKELEQEEKAIKAYFQEQFQASGMNEIRGDYFIMRHIKRKGRINYAAIPELKGLDLEPYRGAESLILDIRLLEEEKDAESASLNPSAAA